MGNKIIAVLLGLFSAFILISLVQMAGHAMYPVMEGVDFTDPDAIAKMMAEMPTGSYLMVALAYLIGSLDGGFVAAMVGKQNRQQLGFIVGGVLMLAGVANFVQLPHPTWFVILCMLIFIPAAYLGAKLAIKLKPDSN